MRNSTRVFVKALTSWLRTEMDRRVDEANAADGNSLPHISSWASGYRAVISGMDSYPGCIVVVDGKTMVDPYVTAFDVGIALGVSDDDPLIQEELVQIYADMLEDCIRGDWHLGGAALDVDNGWTVDFGYVQGVSLALAKLKCQVDLGGFVYAEDADGEEDQDEMVPVPEMPSGDGADAEDGEDDLSPLPQPGGEGDIAERG